MRYLTHIAKSCEADAKDHGVMPEIQKLAHRIEQQQSIDNLDPHDQFLKKPLGKSYRLVIGKKYDGDDCLLILWRVFAKATNEYKRFCENTDPFLHRFEQACNAENLNQIWSEKRIQPDIPQLTKLSEEERVYLYQQDIRQGDDWLILETEEWVQRTHKETGEYRSYISSLYPILYDLLEHPRDQQEVFSGNVGMLYRHLPEKKILYLVAPIREERQEDIASLKEHHKKELYEPVDKETLLRKSKRAYPSLVVYDSDLWIHGIQETDEKANLALSEEEAEVLLSRENGYPLFINGRPGSGKSTVLQYLFAEHLYHHLSYNRLSGLPLYLTYNKELLEIARENVFRILTSNAYKLTNSRGLGEEEARAAVDHSFVDFREYLFSFLPPEKRFDERKYMGFPEFRLLFEKKFSKYPDHNIRKITAELAWHVIRTYIKGTVAEENEYLEPDAFREMPSKPQKSITATTYDTVHHAIWSNWYKDLCEKDGFWDDQDLARTLLILSTAQTAEFGLANHPVVFCDEAQDFTRNELRLIFRLSLFSRRDLTPETYQRVPFAFAGDPFQTLNPTGFDWESTRTTFYQTIIAQLDRRQKPTLDFNFKELSFNYRSTRNIVQLCNFIHLIRGIAFYRKGLRPQKTWFDEAANMPVYFDVASPVLQSKLREQQEIVIIVPCQEGEELNYVQDDEFLKTVALSEDGQQINRNVLSPMRAKGQEFSRVVIYKFGEACRKDYTELLELMEPDHSTSELSQEKIVPLEYFINRLYVAASRAEKRLFIADTDEGLKQFWKFFEKYDPDSFVDKYRNSVQQPMPGAEFPWKIDYLVKIQQGDQDSWQQDHDDPARLAEEFFQRGLRLKDTYMLGLAIQNYRAAGKNDKALECEGSLLELTADYEKAGDRFEVLGKRDKARQLYWKAEAFNKIVRLGENSLENTAADFMLSQNDKAPHESPALLKSLLNSLKEQSLRPDEAWAKVIGTILKHIIGRIPESELAPLEWNRIQTMAEEFFQRGLIPGSDERVLHQLRVRATAYPEKLEILQKIGSEPKIIADYYAQNKQVQLNDTQQEILLQALQKSGRYDEVEALIDTYPLLKRYAVSLVAYIREKDLHPRIEALVQKVFIFLTDQGMWEVALDFASEATLPVDDSLADVIRKYSWDNLLHVLFIKALATSENLPKARKSIKNDISKYLSYQLLDRASAFYRQLTVSQAGAALERANMIKDCLEFYENVYEKQTWPANEEDIQLAEERWLVCKSRQLVLQNDDKGRQRVQHEIHTKQEEWTIDAATLPEYPVVDLNERPRPVKPTRKPPVPVPVEIDQPVEPEELNGKIHSRLSELFKDLPPFPNPVPPPGTMKVPLHSQIELSIALNGHAYRCTLIREKGKMTVHYGSEEEMLTLTAKGLKLRGSDDDFEEGIQQQQDRTEGFARYFIIPWNLTCVLRQHENFVYVDMYLGEQAWDLISLRLA